MNPFKFDHDGTPCFTKRDVDDYGMPEMYGYTNYLVVDNEQHYVYDYTMEHEADLRKIHRYDRVARFKATLLDILGERGNIPESVMGLIKTYLKTTSKDPWNDCRKILKHYKQRSYYNKIPMILRNMKIKGFIVKGNLIEELVNEFRSISLKFEEYRDLHDRSYFPNLRFIVIKLLEKHGVTSIYTIPKMRTDRKHRSLDQLWNILTK